MGPSSIQALTVFKSTVCFLLKNSTFIIVTMPINQGFNSPLVLVCKSAKPIKQLPNMHKHTEN